MEDKKPEIIDLPLITKKLFAKKKLFIKTLAITFILASFIIVSIPRYYNCTTELAPEIDNKMPSGGLSSLASSFGIDLSNIQSNDAISPLLYPDLMEDNGFVSDLLSIHIKTKDGAINSNYHDYLLKHQKIPWWLQPVNWFIQLTKGKPAKGGNDKPDPYILNKEESEIMDAARANVKLSVDKKTAVLTIVTTAQDPLVSKILADSVRFRLQKYITAYRTNKARIDVDYYQQLAKEAKAEYEKARRLYGSYADANNDIVLESYRAKQEDLENDMQLKYNAYSTMITQLQAAKAKVQERTPAFTVIQGAAMPVKPAGPKRVIFVLMMLFFDFIGTAFYITRKDIHVQL